MSDQQFFDSSQLLRARRECFLQVEGQGTRSAVLLRRYGEAAQCDDVWRTVPGGVVSLLSRVLHLVSEQRFTVACDMASVFEIEASVNV